MAFATRLHTVHECLLIMDSPMAAPTAARRLRRERVRAVRVRLMEGYEEKTPHAPSHKVHQYLMTTASQSTATTPEPMHTQSRRPTL